MSNRLDLNSATSAELLTLCGIGKTTAKKLIAFRETHDPPLTYQQLIEELGISLKRINRWVAGSILPLSEDPPHVSGEEMSSATSANESSEEEQPVDISFVDWQSKVRLLEEEGAVLVSETAKQMEAIHSLSRENYSLKEQLSERESELSFEIIKSSRLEETIEQLRRDREDQQTLNNKLQDLLAQEKTNQHLNRESASVLKDSLIMATEATNNLNVELINKTDACRQTEDLLAQTTIKGDSLRIQVMQLTEQNNTLIGETQKLRIDTGRLQELVTNLQSSAAPDGKVTLNPYVTMPMINPSPLDHLAQHALVTPSIPPPPPLATHSTVHLQYEDTQVKGRLNNHGQARGGDTEGTASSYHRPDNSTHHDLAPMSAPQDFSIFNVPPSKLNPYQQLVMLMMHDNFQVTHPRPLTDRSLSHNITQDIMMNKVSRVMTLTRDDPNITTSPHNTMPMRGTSTNHSLGPMTVRLRAMRQIQETEIKDQLLRMVVACLL